VRKRKDQPLTLGNLSTFQDLINAYRVVLRLVAGGELEHTTGNCLFRGLGGLREAMEANQDAGFEARIAAYEQAASTGQSLDRPSDVTLQ
jgi:hypothetical protein